MRVGLLLAAGRSRRFGTADKLLVPFFGKPLVCAAAEILRALPLDHRIAVTASAAVETVLEGFTIVRNDAPEAGQGRSLALGASAAADYGAMRLLVLLGDMPFVTVTHASAVLKRCRDDCPAASVFGVDRRRSPPACFPPDAIGSLRRSSGDEGARSLLAGLPPDALVAADERTLGDIDTPGGLEALAS